MTAHLGPKTAIRVHRTLEYGSLASLAFDPSCTIIHPSRCNLVRKMTGKMRSTYSVHEAMSSEGEHWLIVAPHHTSYKILATSTNGRMQ